MPLSRHPANPAPGEIVTGSYTVRDTGSAVSSSWDDSVYLATGATGTTYSTSDPLLERIPQTQALAAGSSYTGHLSFPLPDIATGTYHLIIVPDSGDLLGGGSETPGASASFSVGPIPTLAVGSPISTTLQQGQQLYYRVTVTSASDVRVALSGLAAAADVTILASPDQVPTSQTAAAGSTSGSLSLPSSEPGVWFVVVVPNASLGTHAVPITASASDVGVTLGSVSPASDVLPIIFPVTYAAGVPGSSETESAPPPPPLPKNGDGLVTLTLNGSGFGPNMTVKLVNGTSTVPAVAVSRRDSTVAFASFPIPSYCSAFTPIQCDDDPFGPKTPELAVGKYDVDVTSHGSTATVPGGFTVDATHVATNASALDVSLSAPSLLRQGWVGALTVTLTNNTSQDLAVPVVKVTSEDALLGAPGVTDTSKFGPAAEIDDPVLSADPAIDPSPPGILAGGQTVSLTFGLLSHTTVGHAALNTVTSVVNTTDTTAIDWTSELAPYQPPGMSAADWAGIVQAFGTDFGKTEGAFANSLVTAFGEAKADGVTLASESDAIGFLVDQEIATDQAAPVSGKLFIGSRSVSLGHVAMTLTDSSGTNVYTTTSWYDGRFAFAGVPAGTYTLAATGYLPDPLQTVHVTPTAIGLSVIASAGATLTGTVTQQGSDTPVPGVIVTASDAAGTLASSPSGTDGSYTIQGLEAGAVTVAATAAGYEPANGLTATTSLAAPTTLDVSLEQDGSITGTVSAPGGGAPAAAQVDAELIAGWPGRDRRGQRRRFIHRRRSRAGQLPRRCGGRR